MLFERLLLLLEASLVTLVGGIADEALTDVVADVRAPVGPTWFIDGGERPLDACIDLSRFRRMPNADQVTEYGRASESGLNLWSKDDRRQIIRSWLERFLLDLQYESFEQALEDAMP